MRRLLVFTALLGLLSLTSCSFSSDFIVINDSPQPIEVTYRFKFAGQITRPATVARSEVTTSRPEHWQELPADRYAVDRVWRTVKLSLLPAEALRVEWLHDYFSHDGHSSEGALPIDELTIRGASGEIVLRGEQVRLNFVKQGSQVFTLTYR